MVVIKHKKVDRGCLSKAKRIYNKHLISAFWWIKPNKPWIIIPVFNTAANENIINLNDNVLRATDLHSSLPTLLINF